MRLMQPSTDPMLATLIKLGLSNDTGRCYLALLNLGALTPKDIAKKLNILPNAVYRLTENLEKQRLIVKLNTFPMKFQSVPVDIAINALVNQKISEIQALQHPLI